MPPQAEANLALEYSTDTRKLEWRPHNCQPKTLGSGPAAHVGCPCSKKGTYLSLGVSQLPAALTRT